MENDEGIREKEEGDIESSKVETTRRLVEKLQGRPGWMVFQT